MRDLMVSIGMALDLHGGGCPSLAAPVADIDVWRGRAQVPEAALRLGVRRPGSCAPRRERGDEDPLPSADRF